MMKKPVIHIIPLLLVLCAVILVGCAKNEYLEPLDMDAQLKSVDSTPESFLKGDETMFGGESSGDDDGGQGDEEITDDNDDGDDDGEITDDNDDGDDQKIIPAATSGHTNEALISIADDKVKD